MRTRRRVCVSVEERERGGERDRKGVGERERKVMRERGRERSWKEDPHTSSLWFCLFRSAHTP